MFNKQPRKFTDEEYETELSAAHEKNGGLGRNRSGVYTNLEDLANEMLRRSLIGVTKYKDKADILTPWKEQMRQRREVLTSSGFPDSAIRKGMYKKAANASKPELNCLSADTQVRVQDEGLVSISDMKGMDVSLLTSAGWRMSRVEYFGVKPLFSIHLKRSDEKKIVNATSDHRWFTPSGTRLAVNGLNEAFTSELCSGDRLASKWEGAALLPDWEVVSVKYQNEGHTFCAVVPETEDFVLADSLLTGNSREGIARARTRSSPHIEQYHGMKPEEG